jgi:WD40 repeat protein
MAYPRVFSLLVLWFLAAEWQSAAGGQPPQRPPVRTDALGDPLPVGAVARMGRIRFQHSSRVTAVAFSRDGKQVVSATEYGPPQVWETATGKPLAPTAWNGKVAGKAGIAISGSPRRAYSPDGTTLATGYLAGVVYLKDVGTGKTLRELSGHEGWIEAVAFSPDGKRLVTSCPDSTLLVWDLHEVVTRREAAHGTERKN